MGLELAHREDYAALLKAMVADGIEFSEVSREDSLGQFLI